MEDECKSMYVMGDVLEAHIQESRLYHTVCHLEKLLGVHFKNRIQSSLGKITKNFLLIQGIQKEE